MMFDASHVLLTGAYFGSTLGPWSYLIASIGIDPLKIGPAFALLGSAWIAFLIGILLDRAWGWYGAVICALGTLWYLPIGTIFAAIYIILLIRFRSNSVRQRISKNS